MDNKLIALAQRQLLESIAATERAHGKTVTPAARIMLEAILLEAMTTRESEWPNRAQFALGSYGAEAKLTDQIRGSFNALLTESYVKQSGDFITTRDILHAAQSKWCNIFPIC